MNMSISEKQIEAFNRKAEIIASDDTLLNYLKEEYPVFYNDLIEDGLKEQGFDVGDDDFEMDLVPAELKIEFTSTDFFEDMGLAETDLSPEEFDNKYIDHDDQEIWELMLDEAHYILNFIVECDVTPIEFNEELPTIPYLESYIEEFTTEIEDECKTYMQETYSDDFEEFAQEMYEEEYDRPYDHPEPIEYWVETIGFNINSYILATMVQDKIKYSDETVTSWFEKNVYEFIKMIDDQEAIDYDLAIGNYEDDLYE